MASINPFFPPNSGDKPWVDQIRKTLKNQLAVTLDTPPVSIFEIPKTLKEEKLQAYVPQRIGLGPNHHFQPELYQKMEQNKLTAVKRVLKSPQIQCSEDQVVEKVRHIIPLICACYDSYLPADDDTLAWLFTIDGLFFIDQVAGYSDHQFPIEAQDLMMLENQIPMIVLAEIQKTISGRNAEARDDYWESKFRYFCESHSPFLLSEVKMDPSRINHLLDYMYHSIVNNETSISREVYITDPGSDPSEKDIMLELQEAATKIIEKIPVTKPFFQMVEFFLKTYSESTEKKPTAEEIKVPSVSELRNIAGVKFHLSPMNRGIRNINFVLKKERSCYLPHITLNIDSEVILRNLVAYEKIMAKNSFNSGYYGLEITEYVDFMCGIIDTAKDVRLLREENIISGDLSDEEIVKLFNGIGRSDVQMNVGSELRKTVYQLNEVYESMPRVWVRRMAEKQLRGSVKIITFLISISSTLYFVREVYLKAFGSNQPHLMLIGFAKSKLSHFLH